MEELLLLIVKFVLTAIATGVFCGIAIYVGVITFGFIAITLDWLFDIMGWY